MNKIKIPYMDLSVKDSNQRSALLNRLDIVLQHGRLINGPEVEQFEKSFANICGTKYAVGVNSGSSALYLSLVALGIGRGDEVIIPAMSWISTAHAVAVCGAIPVFADIQTDLNIDVTSVERLLSPKTKAIIPVHFMGKMSNLIPLKKLCLSRNIFLIEDASQAFGAKKQNIIAGATGILNCFSLNSMKLLPSLGEAGIITTDDDDLAERLRSLRYCGMVDKVHSTTPSLNYRLETIQAAILLERLGSFELRKEKRRAIASIYNNSFTEAGVKFLADSNDGEDVYYGYTLLIEKRDQFIRFMTERGIEVKVKHAPLMCQQIPYTNCRKDISNASSIVEKIVCIPNHENISDDQALAIIKAVVNFHE